MKLTTEQARAINYSNGNLQLARRVLSRSCTHSFILDQSSSFA
jgi:hypothetical protein